MQLVFTDIYALAFVLCLALYGYYRRHKGKLPLPPGPRKLPFIGNLLDMKMESPWLIFTKWGRDYNSDIIHASAPGLQFVILNSLKVANELLDKRSGIYSSRPHFTMVSELMGWGFEFSIMPYGEEWRERRRLFQRHFPATGTEVHKPKIMESVQNLLLAFLERQEDFFEQVKYMSGSFSLSLAYGIKVEKWNDPLIDFSEKVMREGLDASIPGAFLVDLVPALKYLPSWFPGAGFKTKAKECYKNAMRFRDFPFAITEEELAKGIAQPSFVSLSLENLDFSKDIKHQREVIRDTASIFYLAGSDTTISAIGSFLLAMVAFPEVQAKAREEIDRLLKHERLPQFEDESLLPYLSAVLKEVLRWRPPTPIGVPHTLDKDDIYNGYYIPASSMVISNIWAISRDENDYPDPYSFFPERFIKDGQLNQEIRDPHSFTFGFGRRICPGSHLALSMMWLTAASILSTFDISKAVDSHGNVIEPIMEGGPGLVSHPFPFKFKMTPRSRDAEELIRSAVEHNVY